MQKGIIFDIEHGSFVDGPGIRTTVFFKGCNLKCAWCHNPESQSQKPQMMFFKDKCIACGRCKNICPNGLSKCDLCGKCEIFCPQNARKISGKEIDAKELFDEIEKYADFSGQDGGITFSGGECMLQIDFLQEMLRLCKLENIHTAVDTAGNVKWENFEKILPYTDMFLYDVKSTYSDIHKKYTGVGNELILNNLARLINMQKRVWIRVPVIPGINDTVEEMVRIKKFVTENGGVEKIELLPYHKMGEGKSEALDFNTSYFDVPSKEKIERLKQFL